jgi:hypothetical protein
MRRRHVAKYADSHDGGVLGSLEIGKQYDEFIPSLAADRIRAAYGTHKTFGNGLKKSVADGMTERIVNVLESIQVEK